jgi:hypothetical protein
MILLQKSGMQDGEISSKLKAQRDSESNPPFSFQLQAFSSYATPQMELFQQNHFIIF